ncbi:MAG: glycosyltransferase family 2 protein [Actinomycetota bacterium]
MTSSMTSLVLAESYPELEATFARLQTQRLVRDRLGVVLGPGAGPAGPAAPADPQGSGTQQVRSSATVPDALRALNELALGAGGDILAFLKGGSLPEVGWDEAILAAIQAGAHLVSGPVRVVAGDRGGGRLGGRLDEVMHQQWEGRYGIGPLPMPGNLAIRSATFAELSGFDERMGAWSESDLAYRAHLAGYDLAMAPGAAVARPPASARQALRAARDAAAQEWKYQGIAFRDYPRTLSPRALAGNLGAIVPAWMRNRHDEAVGSSLAVALRSPLLLAAGAMRLAGRAEILLSPAAPPQVFTRPPGNEADPLPAGPALVLTGEPRAVRVISRLLDLGTALAVPPRLRLGDGDEGWDVPAPWSLRLARLAGLSGWAMPVTLAAKRLEYERPATLGAAIIGLHQVYAWWRSKGVFGMCATADEARALSGWVSSPAVAALGQVPSGAEAGRRPGPAVVALGHESVGADVLRIGAGQALCDPSGTLRQIEAVLSDRGWSLA